MQSFTAVKRKVAFNNQFFNATTNSYATGSNTTYAMPLAMDIADKDTREALLRNLVADIRSKGNAFTSGEVGYRYLLDALTTGGHSDVIYDMNNQSDRPGYGYELKKGATALTEKWDAGGGSSGSQNHFMSGEISSWFFEGLAGISTDESEAGFKMFGIKPALAGDLKWVKSSYQTTSGLVAVHWERKGKQLMLDVDVPPNTQAMVYIPTVAAQQVQESGKPASISTGVKFLKYVGGQAVYQVASGSYHFQAII